MTYKPHLLHTVKLLIFNKYL